MAEVLTILPQPSRSVKSFGYQWAKFRSPYTQAQLERLVLQHTGLPADYFRGKCLLDGGCGAGYQSRYLSGLGATIVSMDLSEAVFVAAENLRDCPNAAVVRGDLMHPPFKATSFDLVYCEGVVHHTANPKHTVRALTRLIKPGGYLAFGVYRKADRPSLKWRFAQIVRSICRHLPQRLVMGLVLLTLPLRRFPGFRNLFLVDPDNSSATFTWNVMYDFIGPHWYQHYLTKDEMERLLYDPVLGFSEVVETAPSFYRCRVAEQVCDLESMTG